MIINVKTYNAEKHVIEYKNQSINRARSIFANALKLTPFRYVDSSKKQMSNVLIDLSTSTFYLYSLEKFKKDKKVVITFYQVPEKELFDAKLTPIQHCRYFEITSKPKGWKPYENIIY